MGAYSKDLRLKVLAATDRGTPRREVVETFGISLATLKRWLKKRAQGEDLSPRFSTGRKRPILSTVEERRALWARLEGSDEATLEQHCELWEERRGVRVSAATMSRAIRQRLGWTFKKDVGCHRARRRSAKCLEGMPEFCRSEAAGVRGRVLDEHRLSPALRQGT
jgi:transposase